MLEDWRFRRSIKRLLRSPHAIPGSYAKADWPDRKGVLAEVPFLAVDFELDGLGHDAHVLQAGWLPFTLVGIPLGEAAAFDIRSERSLDNEAVAIHGIGEQRARAGGAIEDVFEELLAALSGRVLIAHGAVIECEVISRISRALYGTAVPVRSICTLALERMIHPRLVGSEPYRLTSARARYHLPPHDLHDALGDALAAAELFLAQARHLPSDTRLGRLEALAARY